MNRKEWPVSQRVARLQWVLPAIIGVFVVVYQSLFVDLLHAWAGQRWHYIAEIIFYGLVGPSVTYFVLSWIRRWLVEKEAAEATVRRQEKRLTLIKLEEGKRVAQHLHREVLPNLAYVANKVDHLCDKLLSKTPDHLSVQQELTTASSTLRQTIGELRQKINQLRRGDTLQSLKQGANFIAEVRRRIRTFERLFRLKFELVVAGNAEGVPFQVESSLWRIIGEALNNVALHAEATTVTLALDWRDPEQAVLSVVDDGKGFDSARALADGKGLGLVHMREETDRCGGTLLIQSQLGEGTHITAALPLPAGER